MLEPAGYWQVPPTEDSREFTAFITPFRMIPVPQIAFRNINSTRVLPTRDASSARRTGRSGVFTRRHHRFRTNDGGTQQESTLSQLEEAGVTLNVNKCTFRQSKVKFLGHVVSAEELSIDPRKVEVITQLDPPSDVSKVMSFLGSTNQLAKFLPGLADVTELLRELMHQDAEWLWGPAQQQSFDRIKQLGTEHNTSSRPLRLPAAAYCLSRPFTLRARSHSAAAGR